MGEQGMETALLLATLAEKKVFKPTKNQLILIRYLNFRFKYIIDLK